MEGQGWMADDFNDPIDGDFDVFKDEVAPKGNKP